MDGKKSLSERDIISKFVLPAIKNVGWEDKQIREEVSFTNGRIFVNGTKIKRGERKRADIILYYEPNIPVAVIEVKDNTHTVGAGIQQALEYARTLDIPVAISSNGDGFVIQYRNNCKSQISNPSNHYPGADECGKTDIVGELIEDCLYNMKDYDRNIVIDERTDIVAKKIMEYLTNSEPMAKTIVYGMVDTLAGLVVIGLMKTMIGLKKAKDGQTAYNAIGCDICESDLYGKDIGTKALSAYIKYYFDRGVNELYTQTCSGNVRMIRCAEKLAFVECDRCVDEREVDGQKYDGLTFKLKK